MNRVGLMIVGILAGCVIAWGCGGGGPPSTPPTSPGTAPTGKALGDPPPLVAEPAEMPDRASPERVLRSMLAGRAAQDLPFLARCEAVTAEKAQLDSLDEARAWRHYCMKSIQPLWDKIEAALEDGAVEFTVDGDRATGKFDVGGAIGRIDLQFIKVAGDWYLQYSEE